MLREKCNRPMLLIERQRAMLLEVCKCIHELGPRYRHGMFSQKCRAYDYRDPSILTLPKYNTITHGKKCFMYEGANNNMSQQALPCTPPPRMIEGGLTFFVWVSSVTKKIS